MKSLLSNFQRVAVYSVYRTEMAVPSKVFCGICILYLQQIISCKLRLNEMQN